MLLRQLRPLRELRRVVEHVPRVVEEEGGGGGKYAPLLSLAQHVVATGTSNVRAGQHSASTPAVHRYVALRSAAGVSDRLLYLRK